jgi:4-alpha-glucanotransferase
MGRLRDLARLFSIQINYTDAAGKLRYASRESLIAALKMRVPDGDLAHALETRKRGVRERGLEPVIVVWGRSRPEFELRLPQSDADGSMSWSFALEDGETREGRVELSSVETKWSDEGYAGKNVVLDVLLPHGYHTLRVEVGGRTFESFVIAAPGKAYAPKKKSWGIFAPLYAAHTRRSWGAGDLGDLLAFLEWVEHLGGGVVATLPMLAQFDDEPSPYSPLSRLFWNELYLDVSRVPEYRPGDEDLGEIAHLQQMKTVDYDAIRRTKRRVLEELATRFTPDEEFAAFERDAREYAEFRARMEQRDSAQFHLYVQYRMKQQMRSIADLTRKSGQGLYLDFPLGVNAGGYDVHRYGHLFAKGVSVGAPPDLFFTKGQNWGFPPFDPDAIREDRYEYFRACIRHHVAHAGILRIDHVMGLHRLFWIPSGAEAKDGVYVQYNADELYAILTLESVRNNCMIVGEDLGTVPEYVPKMMSKHGIRRMYVVQYEIKPDGETPLNPPPAASVASINTHDMPTFTAFWNGHDIDDRVQQGLLDAEGAGQERETREQMRRALVGFLGVHYEPSHVLAALLLWLSSTDAEIVLANLEDLWNETEPQNVPGVPERSWRHKLRLTLEQARSSGQVRNVLSNVNEKRGG